MLDRSRKLRLTHYPTVQLSQRSMRRPGAATKSSSRTSGTLPRRRRSRPLSPAVPCATGTAPRSTPRPTELRAAGAARSRGRCRPPSRSFRPPHQAPRRQRDPGLCAQVEQRHLGLASLYVRHRHHSSRSRRSSVSSASSICAEPALPQKAERMSARRHAASIRL